MSKVILTEADKGKTITVRQGDVILINLKENPTTGYRWAIDKTNTRVLALQRADFSSAPSAGVGAGGTRIFVFDTKEVGTVHLHLKLWREWEGDTSVINQFDVIIQVQR